ncbi:MAG: uroporphyrinogen decarboxylase family protein [Ignisphaera sp.]|uniref:Uroporphyrinogen decarboxylase (URO-D) domain-containing protein n=1 Tax=Ignisphaera aggregans TaxID=334771 RepID=A0A7J3JPD4_9CREN
MSMDSFDNTFNKRLNRIENALTGKRPDRVPFLPAFHYFPARYCKVTYHDYAFNYEIFYNCVVKVFKEFNFDAAGFVAPGAGIPGPLGMPIIFAEKFPELLTVIPSFTGPLHDILGDKYTKWPGRELDVNKPAQIAYVDAPYMTVDEYAELARDPEYFLVNKIIPRVYRNLSMPGTPHYIATLIKIGLEAAKFNAVNLRLFNELKNMGYPILPFSFSTVPADYIADNLRCPHSYALTDIYRVPAEFKAASEALLPYLIKLGLKPMPPANIRSSLFGTEVGVVFIPLHLNEMLPPKLYSEFYWPYLRKLVEEFHRSGLKSWIFFEGDHTPHLETILEAPKGSIIAYFERTNLRKAGEVLGGHVVLMGGISVAHLIHGTPERVFNEVCNLLKEMKEFGVFIFSGSGVGGIPDETKPENLRAAVEAVSRCGEY